VGHLGADAVDFQQFLLGHAAERLQRAEAPREDLGRRLPHLGDPQCHQKAVERRALGALDLRDQILRRFLGKALEPLDRLDREREDVLEPSQ
jgi:hypothetical protein